MMPRLANGQQRVAHSAAALEHVLRELAHVDVTEQRAVVLHDHDERRRHAPYRRAHRAGALQGTVGVAKMVLKGEGAPRNASEALEHYRAAADRGSADALNYIWWDTLQSAAQQPGAPSKEFLVGLDPAAYIKGSVGDASRRD